MASLNRVLRHGRALTAALLVAAALGRPAVAADGEDLLVPASPSPYVDLPVPAVMIYAGQPISDGALTVRRVARRYVAAGAYVADFSELRGKLARSTLVPGRPITPGQIREPDVINASKPVKMIYRSGTLVVTGDVIPLSSASVGEMVRARNVNTGLVVSGIAQPDGTLLVAGQ